MSEKRRIFWQAVKCGLGLGPRRDMSPEARLQRALEAMDRRYEKHCRIGHRNYETYCCTKPQGHDGKHGYTGCFWDDAEATARKSVRAVSDRRSQE